MLDQWAKPRWGYGMVRYVATFVNSQKPQWHMGLLREPRNLQGMSLSLSLLVKRKSSSTIAAFLVEEKISYPVSERIDQRIEWDRREMLVKNYF